MPQRGPITQAELWSVLQSTTDPLYLAPFIERGYGSGLESLEAICNVLARVSAAIDRTTQAMFILPWSGQTNPPAAGASLAAGTLEVMRTLRAELPLTLLAGAVLYEEVEVDWSRDGGVPVFTGRQYTLRDDFTFLPGEMGPVSLAIVSTTPGYGYANPLPEKITHVAQPGSGFSNIRASVTQGSTTAQLVVSPEPDVVVPEHVGQYVEFTAGANAGQVRLAGGYVRATAGIDGGALSLLPIFVVRNTTIAPTGTFVIGEDVYQETAGIVSATGRLRAVTAGGTGPWYMVIEYTSGTFLESGGPVGNIKGVLSTAQFVVEVNGIITSPFLANEAGTASWRVLDWWTGFGLTVSNPASPLPGDLAMLDTLGAERKLPRAPGESDDSYRLRIAKVGDLVSPNAIRRVGNRVWSRYGITVCLREVGHALFPGVFCEGDAGTTATLANYSYDLDCIRMRGASTGFPFSDGERVVQDNGGVLTVGRVVSTRVPATVVVPGVYPATRVVATLDATVLDVANIRGPGFVAGVAVVGDLTGASFLPGLFEGSLRVQDRFKLNLDYTEFRAFFLVGLPPTALGEFGLAFDSGPNNAFDAAPYLAYFDGFPLTGAVLNRTTWQAIDNARAGGVGFDLVLDTSGCV